MRKEKIRTIDGEKIPVSRIENIKLVDDLDFTGWIAEMESGEEYRLDSEDTNLHDKIREERTPLISEDKNNERE